MSYAFLDVKIGQSPSSRIIIELYEKDAPKTCRFFKSLLNHPNGYKGTRFQRVIEDFMIQGGDVDLEKFDSIGGAPDTLENADHPVDKAGLIGLARTTAAENNAQFFITLVSAEHLQGVHTIFGNVVKGLEVAEKIGQVEVDDSDNPVTGSEVVIVTCGELQPRKPRPSSPRAVSPPSKPSHDSNGKSKGRSRSPRRDSDRYKRRSRSPSHRHSEHKHRRNSRHDDDDKPRHHHHHRRRHRSAVKQDIVERAEHQSKIHSPERKESPSNHKSGHGHNQSPKKIPTGPRGYQPRQRYRPESNYGRLGYDVGYDDDVRDDEYRLREVERGRDGERGHEEPRVTFKGRGTMKYRERY